MVATSSLVSLSVLAAAYAVTTTDAHGALKVPKPEFLKGKSTVGWVVTLSPAWKWEGSGSWAGGDQAGQYAKLSKKNGHANLRSFLESKGVACGFTNAKATAQSVPSTKYALFQGNGGGGFTHQVRI
jgi:hypothetical protein